MIATEADIPLIVDLALEAHAGSVWEEFADTVTADIEASVRALMARDDAAVFVSERGVLMLATVPVWFNHAVKIAHEVFFYATKGGDALRREGKRWAAGKLITISRHERTDPRLEKLLTRAGLVPIEHTFIGRA